MSHSIDFRSVKWNGRVFNFTPNQAAIIRVLWTAWENGTPDVGQDTLFDAADCITRRMSVVFRNNPAWQTMVVSLRKGAYRLGEPDLALPRTNC